MALSLLLLLLPFCLFTTGYLTVATGDSTPPQGGSNFNSSSTIAPFLENNQSSVTQHTRATQSHQSTRERILYITGPEDDYYYDDVDDNETRVSVPPPAPAGPCLYDRCEHLTPTCEEIQRRTPGSCLCPGINGPKIKPDSPHLAQVLPGEIEMTVNWCSPLSTIYGYRVLYGRPESPMEKGPVLNASYRSYSIGNLLPNTRYMVCVVAFNHAGESPADENEEGTEGRMTGPCRNFHTTPSKQSQIYLGVGLGLATLAVVLVVLGYWLWRKQRSRSRKVNEEEEMGIPNHIYMAGSVNQL